TKYSLRLGGHKTVGHGQLGTGLSLVITEARTEKALLLTRRLDEGEELLSRLAMRRLDPGCIERNKRMVGGQRSLAGVDRDQRDARIRVFAQVTRIATGIPVVVVPDRLLFDGDGRHIGQCGSSVIRFLQVL